MAEFSHRVRDGVGHRVHGAGRIGQAEAAGHKGESGELHLAACWQKSFREDGAQGSETLGVK